MAHFLRQFSYMELIGGLADMPSVLEAPKGNAVKQTSNTILRRSEAYAAQGESDRAHSKAILGQSEAIKAHNKSDDKSNKSMRQQIKQIKQIKRRTPAASIRGDLTLAK